MSERGKDGFWAALKRTVHGRFLVAYIPAVLLLIALFFGGFEFVAYRSAAADLRERMTRLGANLSIVLAEPVAIGQTDLIRSVVANAINDRDVSAIRVVGLAGQTLASLSRDGANGDQTLVFDKPIMLGAGDRTRTVGQLTVVMTKQRLHDAMIRRLYFAGSLAAMLLAAIVIVGSFVYRRVIGEPLGQLIEIINETDQGRGIKRIDPVRDDEVGDVFRAFNKMRDRQHRNELELETTRAGLEKRVRERTADLKRAHDEALAANRAKSQFLANMSHEFRTPLNSIIGFSEILASDAVEDATLRREYANDVRESGVHLLTLINDLLDLSKAEAGKLELHESVLDIESTIDACVGMIRNSAADKGLSVSVSVPASSPAIRGDERKIRQMILNLLSNAAKFTPKGGRIEISSRPTEEGGLEIAVADTGIGIPEKDQTRILEPFVQVDSAFTRAHTGTGLGLPLVRILAELHGGSLKLVSTPDHGTTVTIRFPAERLQYDARIARVAE